ncbi:hypothetical protein HN615_13880 [Candidatus Woesearchaeota archaeon]|nr:hypothetical protein [Candidatus Woesearchaeota archaeon]
MNYDAFMDRLFYYCVKLLEIMANLLGMSYKELNIWIFVVIHPLITLWLAIVLWRCKKNTEV